MLPSVLMLSPTYESSYGPARDSVANFAAEFTEQGGKTRIRSAWRSSSLPEIRTTLLKWALQTEYEMVLWIDSDNMFAPEHGKRIVMQSYQCKTIVGALYRSRCEYLRYVCETKENFTGLETGLLKAYWVGFGLTAMPMAVLRAVFDKYGDNAFRMLDNEFGTVIPPHLDNRHGDDVAFCRHWLLMGQDVYVDASTRIGHIGPTIFNIP